MHPARAFPGQQLTLRAPRPFRPSPLPAGAFGFIPVLHEKTRTGDKGGIPGFPTLKTLKATTRLDRVGVQVFNQSSKRESLVLCCSAPAEGLKPDAVASVILGERCYIEWPFLKVGAGQHH